MMRLNMLYYSVALIIGCFSKKVMFLNIYIIECIAKHVSV